MLKIKKCYFLVNFLVHFLLLEAFPNGQQLFAANCSSCHFLGTNVIIPEKNLTKETLDANGLNNVNAIIYQVRNGKNGMPAFGGRLTEAEIHDIAQYIFKTF
jgi:cytochrome c6